MKFERNIDNDLLAYIKFGKQNGQPLKHMKSQKVLGWFKKAIAELPSTEQRLDIYPTTSRLGPLADFLNELETEKSITFEFDGIYIIGAQNSKLCEKVYNEDYERIGKADLPPALPATAKANAGGGLYTTFTNFLPSFLTWGGGSSSATTSAAAPAPAASTPGRSRSPSPIPG